MAFLGDEPLPNPESLDIKFTDDTVCGGVSLDSSVRPLGRHFSSSARMRMLVICRLILQVVVDIRDPHANDLTLVDLPGLVHSMENEDEQHYADQITDLTRKYIRRDARNTDGVATHTHTRPRQPHT